MGKFENMLASDSTTTLSTRAKNLSASVRLETESFIGNLRKEKLQLEARLNDLTDLAPENTFSLRPGGDAFSPVAWVKEIHKTKMDLSLKAIQLEVAEDILTEWFEDEKPKGKK